MIKTLSPSIPVGIGGEALEVAQAVIVTTWFPNNSGLALGLTLTAARISSAANDNISPSIFAHTGSPDALNLLGVVIAALSVVAAIIIAVMTKLNIQAPGEQDMERQSLLSGTSDTEDEATDVSTAALLDSTVVVGPIPWYKSIHPAFWPLCVACIFCYATVNPYMHILQGNSHNHISTMMSHMTRVPGEQILSRKSSPGCTSHVNSRSYVDDWIASGRLSARSLWVPINVTTIIFSLDLRSTYDRHEH